VAQIHPNCDLILRVDYGSVGWGSQAHGRRRNGHRSSSPRRRFARVGRSRCSGLGFGRDQAPEVEHDVGNPSRRSRRRVRARVGDPHGEGGSGRQTRRRARVPGATEAYRLRHPVQHDQGREGKLTKGSRWPEVRWRRDDDDDWRRRGRAPAEEDEAGVAGPSGWRE
jgi:hypothetical protein